MGADPSSLKSTVFIEGRIEGANMPPREWTVR